MVGVVKQKKKATGELLEYTIQMGRSVTSEGLETENMAMMSKGFVGMPKLLRRMRPSQMFSMTAQPQVNDISQSKGIGMQRTRVLASGSTMLCAMPMSSAKSFKKSMAMDRMD